MKNGEPQHDSPFFLHLLIYIHNIFIANWRLQINLVAQKNNAKR